MASLSHDKGRELLDSGEFSDFTIVCKGKEWKVHKMVVCSESDYFRAVAKGNFDGGATDWYELKEEDPGLIQLVLDWMYTGGYETETKAYLDRNEKKKEKIRPAGGWEDDNDGNDNNWEDPPLYGSEYGDSQEDDAGLEGGASQRESGNRQEDEKDAALTVPVNADVTKKSDWVAYYVGDDLGWSASGYTALSPEQAEQSLLTHLFVYTAADRLGLSNLQDIASGIVLDMTEAFFRKPWLAGIIQQLCDNTAPQDSLRSRVFAYCCNNYYKYSSDWSRNEKLAKLIEKYEPVAWNFAEQWLPAADEKDSQIDRLECQLKNAEASRDAAQQAGRTAAETVATHRATLSSLEDYFKKGNFECKSCGANLAKEGTGFKIFEMATDPSGAVLSVPKVYILCPACRFKDFVDVGDQLTGDKAYSLPHRYAPPGHYGHAMSLAAWGLPPDTPPPGWNNNTNSRETDEGARLCGWSSAGPKIVEWQKTNSIEDTIASRARWGRKCMGSKTRRKSHSSISE